MFVRGGERRRGTEQRSQWRAVLQLHCGVKIREPPDALFLFSASEEWSRTNANARASALWR